MESDNGEVKECCPILEKHEIVKSEERIQCQSCHEYGKPGRTSCTCGKFLPGLSPGVEG